MPDNVSGSQHFVPVTRNLCRSSVYDMLLKFLDLPVIVTGRKRTLSVTHKIVPYSDRWPAVISCTVLPWEISQSNIKNWALKVPKMVPRVSSENFHDILKNHAHGLCRFFSWIFFRHSGLWVCASQMLLTSLH